MKKIILFLLLALGFVFQSCTSDTSTAQDNDTISEVFEVKNISFATSNSFSALIDLNPAIFTSDVVLVYRLAGIENGKNVWKLLPETYYLNNGTLDFGYNFDFTQNDVNIYMIGNNLGTVTASYRTNQVFRIVIVPGSFSQNINKNNIDEVLHALNKDEKSIQKIQF